MRISESLAKMELKPFATASHVEEALRDQGVNVELCDVWRAVRGRGFATEEQETIQKIEKNLKRRFAVGSQVSEHYSIPTTRQKYPERLVNKVIYAMVRREELQYRMQRKMLYRIK